MKQEQCLVQSDAQSLVWTQFQHLQEQMLSGKKEKKLFVAILITWEHFNIKHQNEMV
jgi:hypothetical protein